MLARFKKWLGFLLFPALCESCDAPIRFDSTDFLCARCAASIKTIRPPHCTVCGRTSQEPRCAACAGERFHFDRACAFAWYEGKSKELLHLYKFDERKILKNFLAGRMKDFAQTHLDGEKFDMLVAVPMDAEKKRRRGFNQSALLASELSKKLGIRDGSRGIARKKSPSSQSLLSKADRKSNIEGCFYATSENFFKEAKKLLLIDDVLTTGETASECARVLKQAGAGSVTVLACARGL